jgi:CrcB protein
VSLIDQISHIHLVGVALGAGVGAVCRGWLDRTVIRRHGLTLLPWATLSVNVLGSLILGAIIGWSAEVIALGGARADQAATVELVIGIGFAGGLTTFSTFSWESFTLVREGRPRSMLSYVALTIGLTLVAVVLGVAAGRAVV